MIDGEEGLLYKRAKAPTDEVFVGTLLQIDFQVSIYGGFWPTK